MDIPVITEKELCEHIEDEDFFLRYGNPVCVVTDSGERCVLISIKLYQRLKEIEERLEHEQELQEISRI